MVVWSDFGLNVWVGVCACVKNQTYSNNNNNNKKFFRRALWNYTVILSELLVFQLLSCLPLSADSVNRMCALCRYLYVCVDFTVIWPTRTMIFVSTPDATPKLVITVNDIYSVVNYPQAPIHFQITQNLLNATTPLGQPLNARSTRRYWTGMVDARIVHESYLSNISS